MHMQCSVIFSTYNQPGWLHKTLLGFAAQDRHDFEVVVADAVTLSVTSPLPATGPRRRDAAHGAGHGIIGMRERVEALGGHAEWTSKPGRGVEWQFTIPKVGDS